MERTNITNPVVMDVLEESYNKYKDKNGKKAKALKQRIDSWKAFVKIAKEALKQ